MRDLPQEGLTAGTHGTIVHVHVPTVFEVEFFDTDGSTIAVETVTAADIRPRAGWDGVSELDEPDPMPEEQARIATLMEGSTARTGDQIDPRRLLRAARGLIPRRRGDPPGAGKRVETCRSPPRTL
ncbi:DUF4926 domain-containing protein [Tsukamurella soli]|uniref:DUF4926 domain-containing protein n=1 Tax=Tsukamurella soli TaxID=644556 RepID=UPI0031E773A9